MKKLISIFLFVICITVLVGCGSKNDEVFNKRLNLTVAKTQLINSNKAILNSLNSTYKIENVLIKLTNGKSIMEIVPGSASKLITTVWNQPVVGDLNGDKINDAALILIQDGGGSGTFYYVVANISTKEGKYIGTNAILLGDRINPQSIKIQKGNIIVNYLDRKENDTMVTKPSVLKTRTFTVKGTFLTEKNK